MKTSSWFKSAARKAAKLTASAVLLMLGSSLVHAQTNSNNLTVLGYVDATNNLYFGTAVSGGSNNAGVSLIYTDSTHVVGLAASQPSSVFLWQDNYLFSAKSKMQLNSNNCLTLYGTNGSNGIVFNPNTTGGITLLGTNSGITFVDGSVLYSAVSLVGIGVNPVGNYSTAIGQAASATGANSEAIGYQASASGNYATAFGIVAAATGGNSAAFGYRSQATGTLSTALGHYAIASGSDSTAMAGGSASGASSIAIGVSSSATATYSTALGAGSLATTNYAVAIGSGSVASGYGSVAEGSGTASGWTAVAIGPGALASGTWSTAFGSSKSQGQYSISSGNSVASVDFSIALGGFNTANGVGSAALGIATTAAADGCVTFGQFNVGLVSTNGTNTWVPTDPVMEIGNGVSGHPSNSVTIFKTGEIRSKGLVQSSVGVRIPQSGDMSMGNFTNGNNPATLIPSQGLLYPGGN